MKNKKKILVIVLVVVGITCILSGYLLNKNASSNSNQNDIVKFGTYEYSKPAIYSETDFNESVIDFYGDYIFLTKKALYLYDYLDDSYRKYELKHTPNKILFFDGNSSTTGILLIENTDNTFTHISLPILEDRSSLSDESNNDSDKKAAFEGFTMDYDGTFIAIDSTFGGGLRYIYYKDGDIHALIMDPDTLKIEEDQIVPKSTKFDHITDPIKKLPRAVFTISDTFPSLITSDNSYYHGNSAGSFYWIKELDISMNVDDVFISYDHSEDHSPVFTKNNDTKKIYKKELDDSIIEYTIPENYSTGDIKNIYYTAHSDIYIEFDDQTFYVGENTTSETPLSLEKEETLSQLNQEGSIKSVSIDIGDLLVLLDDGIVYEPI